MDVSTGLSRKRTLLTLGLAAASHFVNDAYGNVYPVLVPLLEAPLGLSFVSGAVVITATRLMSSVLQPLFGRWADRSRLPALVPLALLGGALLTGALGFTGSAVLFIILSLLAGSANAAFHPPALALVRSLSSDRRGAATSTFLVGGNIGRALGPLFMAGVALWFGARGVALLAVPGIALSAYLLRSQPPRPAPASQPVHQVAAVSSPPVLWLVTSRWRPLTLLLLITLSRGVVTNAILTFWPLLHGHDARALVGSAGLVALMLLAGAAGNLLGGALSDRMSKTGLIAGATFLSGACAVAFAAAAGPWVYLLAALTGFFAMSTNAVTMVLGQDLLPESVAMASGVALGFGNAVVAGTVAILAVVGGVWGGQVALLASGVIGLLGLPAALLYPRQKEQAFHALSGVLPPLHEQ